MSRNVVSSPIAFATIDDLLKRYDKRLISRLVSDTGSVVSDDALSNNAILISLLSEASALVESYAYRGMRYNRDDLLSIYRSNTVSRELLVGLVCALAVQLLWRRRGDPATGASVDWEIANNLLRQLERGDNVFAFDGTMHAGIALESVTNDESLAASPRLSALRRITGNVMNG